MSSRVRDVSLLEETEKRYLNYALSVITSRALPDVRDGLKPVQRRILYSMYHHLKLMPNQKFRKSATVVGECFVAGTLVTTPTGLVPIEKMEIGDQVVTQGAVRRVTQTYVMPPQPLKTVTLRDGRSITCTLGQAFKVLNPTMEVEWKEAKDLEPNDVVLMKARPQLRSSNSSQEVHPDVAYMLGLFLADGWVDRSRRGYHRMALASTSRELCERFAFVFNKHFDYEPQVEEREGPLFQVRISNSKLSKRLMERFQLHDKYADNITIPHQVLSSSRASQMAFLSGFLDGDGSVHKTRALAVFTSVRRRFLAQLQVLLHSFGIHGRLLPYDSAHRRKEGHQVEWALEVCGASLQRLIPQLSVCHPKKTERLKAALGRPVMVEDADEIPYLGTSKQKKGWEAQDVTFGTIKTIEDAPADVTYDIQVEVDHEFVAEGMLVHNCMGKHHPHGDQAIYDAMVRMAQNFSLLHPLVDGYGNFGSIDGDKAAAMRYCVTGDAMVRATKGSVPIAKMVKAKPNTTTNISRDVLDRSGQAVHASRFFHSGDHPTLRIKTDIGFALTGSQNHPVLCLVDVMGVPMLLWKLMEEIKPGDYVALARHYAPDESPVEDEALAVLAGAMVAEGWVGEERAGFNNTDPAYFDEVVQAYDEVVGGSRYVYQRELASGRTIWELDVQNLTAFRKSLLKEMIGLRSESKVIPSFVWGRSQGFKRLFLQSLFEGDGSSSILPRNTMQVSYSTRSQTLAKELQQLLLEFGVVSKISTSQREEHKVVLTNQRDVKLFARRVGFLGQKQEKLLEELANLPEICRGLSKDFIPFVSDYIRSEEDSVWLRKHNIDRVERWERDRATILAEIQSDEVKSVILPIVDAGYYYASVCDVEDTGMQPVYSLRVDSECHSFLTNGFVSHNTESRLQSISLEMLEELKQNTVVMQDNFDGSIEEPVVLPARFPHLLVNGSSGIAVGMATNIPPHNLGEVMDALLHLIDNPDVTTADLTKIIKGPDFPTGGEVLAPRKQRAEIYEQGQGNFMVRGEWREESVKGRKKIQRLVIKSIPYNVNRSVVVEKIAEVIVSKKLPGLVDVRDESTEETRIVLEVKSGTDPELVMAYLYKNTPMEQRFSLNMTCLVPTSNEKVSAPERLSLKQVLEQFVEFRFEVLTRRFENELKRLQDRIHILQGFRKVFGDLDEAIRIIRESDGRKDSHEKLKERFKLTDRQTEAILDTRLYRISKLEIESIMEELRELRRRADDIEAVLGSRRLMMMEMKKESEALRETYAVPRKTRVRERVQEVELQPEDLIQDEDTHVVVTHDGWIKRIKTINDISTIRVREGDQILAILPGSTVEMVCFFTNLGGAYTARIWDVPATAGYGSPLQSMFKFKDGERCIQAISLDPRICGDIGLREEGVEANSDEIPPSHLLVITEQGQGQRLSLADYREPSNKTGRRFARLSKGDQVILAELVTGEETLVLTSEERRYLLFGVDEVKFLASAGKGVRAMQLDDGDRVFGAAISTAADEGLVLETVDDVEVALTPENCSRGKRAAKGTRKRGVKGWKQVLTPPIVIPSLKDEEEPDEVEEMDEMDEDMDEVLAAAMELDGEDDPQGDLF